MLEGLHGTSCEGTMDMLEGLRKIYCKGLLDMLEGLQGLYGMMGHAARAPCDMPGLHVTCCEGSM